MSTGHYYGSINMLVLRDDCWTVNIDILALGQQLFCSEGKGLYSPVRISARRDAGGWLTGVSHTIVPGTVPSLLVTLMRWRVPGVTPPVVMLLLLLMLLMLMLLLVRFMMSRSWARSGGAGRSVGRVNLGPGVAVVALLGLGLPGVEAVAVAGRAVDLPGGGRAVPRGGRLGLGGLAGRGRAHLVRPVQAGGSLLVVLVGLVVGLMVCLVVVGLVVVSLVWRLVVAWVVAVLMLVLVMLS